MYFELVLKKKNTFWGSFQENKIVMNSCENIDSKIRII